MYLTPNDRAFIIKSSTYQLLTKEEEYKLIFLFQNNKSKKALDTLIKSYVRLVIAIAYRFSKKKNILFIDLVQEGILGLLKAAKRFDTSKGARFSTYARWWILSFIQTYIIRDWSLVRFPTGTFKCALFDKKKLLLPSSDAEKDIAEASSREHCLKQADVSFDSYSFNDQLMNRIESKDISPEDYALQKDLYSKRCGFLKKALASLSKVEMVVIQKHFFSNPKETLRCIGLTLNLTRDCVRQIERRALRKLKKKLLNQIEEHNRSDLLSFC